MKLQSLALRSELLALSGLSELICHADYCVQRTPSEPDFWMGNQLIMQDHNRSAAATVALFEEHFPDASHRSIVWDKPGLDQSAIATEFAPFDCALDAFDTLSLQGIPKDAVAPDRIVLRALDGDADWAAAIALQAEIGVEEGRDPVAHGPYLARRNANRRAQIARGLGRWFAAFDGDVLVAQMGLFHDSELARYQHVETKRTHRSRGICSALLRHAAVWALARTPNARLVIVADADSDAGRLYARMGFCPSESLFGVLRPG